MSTEVKTKRVECRALINECQHEIEALRMEWDEAIKNDTMHPYDEDFNVE